MRLIDADALLEELEKLELRSWNNRGMTRALQGARYINNESLLALIANAPTVQREGWVSVPIEPTDKMWQDAFDIHDITYHGGCQMTDEIMRIKAIYKAMISAAPTDKE